MVSPVGSSAFAATTNTLFAKRDIRNKGTFDKSDLQSALSKRISVLA
jgi:hypothetical protein